MNLDVLFFVFVLNTFLCLTQYLVEKYEERKGKISPRHSIIPGTEQKFLYWEDFYTQTYGDFLGLIWIVNGFAHLIFKNKLSNWEWIIFLLFSILMMVVFFWSTAKAEDHKPDWGYPKKGKISLGGLVHLPYFGALSSMALICFINIISGDLEGVVLWTTLIGGLFYVGTFLLDIKSGNFDKLHKLSEES